MYINQSGPKVDEGAQTSSSTVKNISGFFNRFLLAISSVFHSISDFFYSLSPWKKTPKATPLTINRNIAPKKSLYPSATKPDPKTATKPNPVNTTRGQPAYPTTTRKVDGAVTPQITPPALITKTADNKAPLTWAETISEHKVALGAIAGFAVVAAGAFYLASCYARKELPTELLNIDTCPAIDLNTNFPSVLQTITKASDYISTNVSTALPTVLTKAVNASSEIPSCLANPLETLNVPSQPLFNNQVSNILSIPEQALSIHKSPIGLIGMFSGVFSIGSMLFMINQYWNQHDIQVINANDIEVGKLPINDAQKDINAILGKALKKGKEYLKTNAENLDENQQRLIKEKLSLLKKITKKPSIEISDKDQKLPEDHLDVLFDEAADQLSELKKLKSNPDILENEDEKSLDKTAEDKLNSLNALIDEVVKGNDQDSSNLEKVISSTKEFIAENSNKIDELDLLGMEVQLIKLEAQKRIAESSGNNLDGHQNIADKSIIEKDDLQNLNLEKIEEEMNKLFDANNAVADEDYQDAYQLFEAISNSEKFIDTYAEDIKNSRDEVLIQDTLRLYDDLVVLKKKFDNFKASVKTHKIGIDSIRNEDNDDSKSESLDDYETALHNLLNPSPVEETYRVSKVIPELSDLPEDQNPFDDDLLQTHKDLSSPHFKKLNLSSKKNKDSKENVYNDLDSLLGNLIKETPINQNLNKGTSIDKLIADLEDTSSNRSRSSDSESLSEKSDAEDSLDLSSFYKNGSLSEKKSDKSIKPSSSRSRCEDDTDESVDLNFFNTNISESTSHSMSRLGSEKSLFESLKSDSESHSEKEEIKSTSSFPLPPSFVFNDVQGYENIFSTDTPLDLPPPVDSPDDIPQLPEVNPSDEQLDLIKGLPEPMNFVNPYKQEDSLLAGIRKAAMEREVRMLAIQKAEEQNPTLKENEKPVVPKKDESPEAKAMYNKMKEMGLLNENEVSVPVLDLEDSSFSDDETPDVIADSSFWNRTSSTSPPSSDTEVSLPIISEKTPKKLQGMVDIFERQPQEVKKPAKEEEVKPVESKVGSLANANLAFNIKAKSREEAFKMLSVQHTEPEVDNRETWDDEG